MIAAVTQTAPEPMKGTNDSRFLDQLEHTWNESAILRIALRRAIDRKSADNSS